MPLYAAVAENAENDAWANERDANREIASVRAFLLARRDTRVLSARFGFVSTAVRATFIISSRQNFLIVQVAALSSLACTADNNH